jgi:hypothetical protein
VFLSKNPILTNPNTHTRGVNGIGMGDNTKATPIAVKRYKDP